MPARRRSLTRRYRSRRYVKFGHYPFSSNGLTVIRLHILLVHSQRCLNPPTRSTLPAFRISFNDLQNGQYLGFIVIIVHQYISDVNTIKGQQPARPLTLYDRLLPDAKHFRPAYGAFTLSSQTTIFHGYLDWFGHLPFGSALHTISLHIHLSFPSLERPVATFTGYFSPSVGFYAASSTELASRFAVFTTGCVSDSAFLCSLGSGTGSRSFLGCL